MTVKMGKIIKKEIVIYLLIIVFPLYVKAQKNKIEQKRISEKSIQNLKAIKASSHPRLYFTKKDIPGIRKQAKTTKVKQWNNLRKAVERHSNWEPLSNVSDKWLSRGSREVYLEESGAMLTNVALAYVISKNPKYLKRARRWLKKMTQIPKKTLTNYGFGFYVMGLARAYDWLYSSLSEKERKMTKNGIVKIEKIMNNRFYPKDSKTHSWRQGDYLHHDSWIPFAGYGVGALALLGEVDGAIQWAMQSRQKFNTAFSLLGDDGAWHEGPADWSYALDALLQFLEPWHRASGEDVYKIPWLKNTGKYRLYSWLPDDTYIYVNDSFRSGRYNISGSASSHVLRKLASIYRDGHLQWLANRDEQVDLKKGPKGVKQSPYSWRHVSPEYPYPQIHAAAWNLLWYDPTVESKNPEELPLDHYFRNHEFCILRSGWGKDASVTSFSCGPRGGHKYAKAVQQGKKELSTHNITHTHAQYNSFTLFSDGKYFITPPGYGLRDSRFANTVLVDGEGLRYKQGTEASIKKFDSQDNYAYILGDATNAYYSDLGVKKAYRHFVFLRPDVWLTYDNVIVDPLSRIGTKRFEWRIHSAPKSHVKIEEDEIVIDRSDTNSLETPVLRAKILEPPPKSHSVEAPRIAFEQNPIYLTSGKKLLNGVNAFMYGGGYGALTEWHNFAVMVSKDTKNGSSLDANMVEGNNLQGVVLHREKEDYVVTFITSNPMRASYVFKAKSLSAKHLVVGLQAEASFDVSLSPASKYGSHYFRIQVVPDPNGRYQSSELGILYFNFGRPSGVREYPDVSE